MNYKRIFGLSDQNLRNKETTGSADEKFKMWMHTKDPHFTVGFAARNHTSYILRNT